MSRENLMISDKAKESRLRLFVPYLLILLQNVLYGFGDPLSKQAYEEIPVYTLLTCRFSLAAAVVLLLFGKKLVSEVRNLKGFGCLLPCVFIAATYIVSNIAITMTAVTSVAFLRSMAIIITPIISCVLLKEKIGFARLALLSVAVAGLYLLCGYGGLSVFGMGEFLALSSSLLMALSLIAGRKELEKISPATLTALQAIVCAIGAACCALFFDGGLKMTGASAASWFAVAYLAVMCTLSGYLLQNIALCYIPASSVSLLQCLCPVLTSVFSYIMLSEKMTVTGMLGALLILISISAASMYGNKKTGK